MKANKKNMREWCPPIEISSEFSGKCQINLNDIHSNVIFLENDLVPLYIFSSL